MRLLLQVQAEMSEDEGHSEDAETDEDEAEHAELLVRSHACCTVKAFLVGCLTGRRAGTDEILRDPMGRAS